MLRSFRYLILALALSPMVAVAASPVDHSTPDAVTVRQAKTSHKAKHHVAVSKKTAKTKHHSKKTKHHSKKTSRRAHV